MTRHFLALALLATLPLHQGCHSLSELPERTARATQSALSSTRETYADLTGTARTYASLNGLRVGSPRQNKDGTWQLPIGADLANSRNVGTQSYNPQVIREIESDLTASTLTFTIIGGRYTERKTSSRATYIPLGTIAPGRYSLSYRNPDGSLVDLPPFHIPETPEAQQEEKP